MQALTVMQIKQVKKRVDDGIQQCDDDRVRLEGVRKEALSEIGNLLHESVIISND